MSNGQFTPSSFATRAKNAGYKWATLELDAPEHRQGHDETIGEFNTRTWPAFREACHSVGILAGPWFTEGGNIGRTPSDADFVIAEMEGPGDYDGIMAADLPACPKAIVTNFNVPLTTPDGVPVPQAAAPLIGAGFSCLTECYLGDNPNATPDRLDFRAKTLGWASSQPVYGVYNMPKSAYAPWHGWPGESDYLGEYLLG